ncbi:MAG: 30S ribosomal protein S8 [Candidatus Paceibacterota bacterium]
MYQDSLIRIKNAQAVGKEKIKVPYSEFVFNILGVLSERKIIGAISKKGKGVKKIIDVNLLYENGQPIISGLKFFSKPSKKVYLSYKDLRPVKQGYGAGIISTPKGIMNSFKARKEKLGGEYLFEIW